jgi:hypothetical protein
MDDGDARGLNLDNAIMRERKNCQDVFRKKFNWWEWGILKY